MKLRIVDRILAAIVGLLLVALAVVPLADTLFNLGILDWFAKFAAFKSTKHLLMMAGGCFTLLVAGFLCLHLATRRPKRQGFVMQTTDAGELSISIRAIEDLVSKCVEKHEELHVTSTSLENTRNGLVISLRVSLATGVNIPLAVNALQKQIRQYVTACSGVDVYEVKVQVDTTSTKAKASIYAVPEMLESVPPLALEQPAQPETTAAQPETREAEEKCLHQRLFGEEEQPAIVPAPPVEEPAQQPEEPDANAPSDEAVAAWDANVPSDETQAELDSLTGLTDDPEEAAIEDLKALDGADDADLAETEDA